MKVIVCIPARYESTRFPAKMLAKQTGKYLIQHTYEQACKATLPSEVLIATDDQRIKTAAQRFGAPCVLTAKGHQSGTDRIAEACAQRDADIVVNLQGDEPQINPDHIDKVAELLAQTDCETCIGKRCFMSTLAAPIQTCDEVTNPNIVKVITDVSGKAIFFSRAAIPYDRQHGGIGPATPYMRHIGIYAYRKAFLSKITTLAQTPLEKTEMLEQLRVLEYGYHIQVGCVDHVCDGIDTLEQYQRFVEHCASENS